MYLAAQRVRAPDGSGGINVAIYTHQLEQAQATWFQPPEAALAFARVPEHRALLAIRYLLPPGGNRVESELEVAGPDTVDLPTLDGARRNARQALTTGALL